MNEQLQAALAGLLGKANEGIDAGTTFLQAQLPDVIQQLLVWKATYSAVLSIIGLATVIVWIVTLGVMFRRARAQEAAWVSEGSRYKYGGAYFALTIGGAISGLIVTITALEMINLTWLKIWIAPKIYLIEYAASLAK